MTTQDNSKQRLRAMAVRLDDRRRRAMRAAGWWRGETILDCLRRSSENHPDQNAITALETASGSVTRLSYRELEQKSARVAENLAVLGIGPGDVVAVQLPNWWQFVVITLACARLGAISNPLQPIFRQRELRFMLGFADTKVLIVPRRFRGHDHLAMAVELQRQLPALEHVFAVGDRDDPAGFERQLLEPAAGNVPAMIPLEADDVAEICYTSGTTGEPKGVMHTYNTLLACLGSTETQGLDGDSVVLMASPLSHQTGFLYGMLMPLAYGARVVYQDAWNAEIAAELIHREGVTFTMGATPFLADLNASDALAEFPPTELKLFICAGAPIPRVLAKAAAERLGARIAAGWGMSENGLVTITQPDDTPEKTFETDGCGWPGQQVRVVDDGGEPLPAGESGRLQTRGAANFVGYLKRPDAYGVDADGWFDSGDIAAMDEDGYIRITGRAKDIIIRGGENVPVVEVEELLYRHPDVVDAAIVGYPDERLGERGCAYVTLRPGANLTFDGLRQYLADQALAKNYWPERLEVIADFPRTPSGKIQKFVLREQLLT